jgi:hypothetical protein
MDTREDIISAAWDFSFRNSSKPGWVLVAKEAFRDDPIMGLMAQCPITGISVDVRPKIAEL